MISYKKGTCIKIYLGSSSYSHEYPSLALASVATVPEPESILLIGAVLIGLGIMEKKIVYAMHVFKQ